MPNSDKQNANPGIGQFIAEKPIWAFSAIGSLIGLVWLAVTAFIWFFFCSRSGTVGDSFGAVNALFSGLALAGVVVAIVLQHVELDETRKVLKEQHSELELQANRGQQEEFDSRFFEVVRCFRSALAEMKTHYHGDEYKSGLDAARYLAEIFVRFMTTNEGRSAETVGEFFYRSFDSDCGSTLLLLHFAVRMLGDEKASSYHGELFRATCPREMRQFYYDLMLAKYPGLEKDAQIKVALCTHQFFTGVEARIWDDDDIVVDPEK